MPTNGEKPTCKHDRIDRADFKVLEENNPFNEEMYQTMFGERWDFELESGDIGEIKARDIDINNNTDKIARKTRSEGWIVDVAKIQKMYERKTSLARVGMNIDCYMVWIPLKSNLMYIADLDTVLKCDINKDMLTPKNSTNDNGEKNKDPLYIVPLDKCTVKYCDCSNYSEYVNNPE